MILFNKIIRINISQIWEGYLLVSVEQNEPMDILGEFSIKSFICLHFCMYFLCYVVCEIQSSDFCKILYFSLHVSSKYVLKCLQKQQYALLHHIGHMRGYLLRRDRWQGLWMFHWRTFNTMFCLQYYLWSWWDTFFFFLLWKKIRFFYLYRCFPNHRTFWS